MYQNFMQNKYKRLNVKSLSILMLLCLSMNIGAQRIINLNDENADANLRQTTSAEIIPQEFLKTAKTARAFAINPALQNANSVSVGDIVNLQLFEGNNYKAIVNTSITNVMGNFTLTLKLPDYPMAFVIITTNTAGKSLVTVSIPELGQSFESRGSIHSDTNYLIEIDKSKIEHSLLDNDVITIPKVEMLEINNDRNLQKASPTKTSTEATECGGPARGENPDEPATIDLLIVYTSGVKQFTEDNYYTDIDNVIATILAFENICLSNSQIGITLNLIHSQQVSYTDYKPGTTIARLHNPNDGYLDDVHDLRKQYGADLVQLITAEYGGGVGGASLVTTDVNYTYCFSTITFSPGLFLQPIQTFAYASIHELGHSMGLGHGANMKVKQNGIFPYSQGWDWIGDDAQKYTSIMGYEGGTFYADGLNRSYIPYFSNPDIFHQGQPTGNIDYADAARSLREIKHVIAHFNNRLLEGEDLPLLLENVVASVANRTWGGLAVTFTWNPVPYAAEYRLFTSDPTSATNYYPVSNGVTLNVGGGAFSTDCSLYNYYIQAVTECGDLINSPKLTLRAYCGGVITTLAATNITHNSAKLNKSGTASGYPTYQLYKYKEASTTQWLTSTDGNLTELKSNTTYQFYACEDLGLGGAPGYVWNGNVLTFTTLEVLTDLDKVKDSTQLSISPNPAKDEIFIHSDLHIEKVEIYSSTGTLVISENNFNEKIALSTLSQGVYLIKVYTNNGLVVSKIVKE